MRIRFLLCSATVVAICALVAACGGSSTDLTAKTVATNAVTTRTGAATTGASGTAANPSVDPCTLLTDADISAGFALSDMKSPIIKVTRTPHPITSDTASCDFEWKAANDSSSNFAIYVYPLSIYQALKTAPQTKTVPELAGAILTSDGYFLAASKITVSITGVVSKPAALSMLQAAAKNSPH